LDGRKVVASRFPIPWHPGAQRLERHAFDPSEHPHEVGPVAPIIRQRGDRKTAVTTDDCGHAMQRRRGEIAVPEHLGGVVRVHVAEAARNHMAPCWDSPLAVVGYLTHRDDPVTLDPDIYSSPRGACPVDNVSTADHQIEPRGPPFAP